MYPPPPPGPPGWGPQQYPPPGYAPVPQLNPGEIICPNPRCGYFGAPRRIATGGANGCLVVLLLFCGIIPGLLYLIFAPSAAVTQCPRCNLQLGAAPDTGGGSSGCLMVSGVVSLVCFVVIIVATIVARVRGG